MKEGVNKCKKIKRVKFEILLGIVGHLSDPNTPKIEFLIESDHGSTIRTNFGH